MSIEYRREINRQKQSKKVRKSDPKPRLISRDPITGNYQTKINNGVEYKEKLYTGNTEPKAVNGNTLEGEHATKINRKRGIEGYIKGQIFNNPVEEEPNQPIKKVKYCFYVTENERRNLYVGGHQKKPILIKSLDSGWEFQLTRSRIDNLGGRKYIIYYEYYKLSDPINTLTLECRSTEPDHNWSINFVSLGRNDTTLGTYNTIYYNRRYGFISLQGVEYAGVLDPCSGIYKGQILPLLPVDDVSNEFEDYRTWELYLTPNYTYFCNALKEGRTDLGTAMMMNLEGVNAVGVRTWSDSTTSGNDTVAFYGSANYTKIEDNFLFISTFYLVRNADLITSFIGDRIYQLKTYDYTTKIKKVNSPVEKGLVLDYKLDGSEVIRNPEIKTDWYTVDKNVVAWDMSYHP